MSYEYDIDMDLNKQTGVATSSTVNISNVAYLRTYEANHIVHESVPHALCKHVGHINRIS